MYRADGTQLKVDVLYNGLKPIVTKCFEPTALKKREIKVETKEGEGSEFIIQLPMI